MVWRHFSLELKRLGSTHTPVVSQLLLSKTSSPVVGVSTVQTLHLCLQDLLPTSAYRDILNAHLQASCRSLHCPNTSLVSPGLTPNLSLSRYPKHSKTCHLRQSIDKSPSTNDLPHSQHAKSETKTHYLNQEYSSSSMPLTLHQQHTNLVSTANPQYKLNTYPCAEDSGAQYKRSQLHLRWRP